MPHPSDPERAVAHKQIRRRIERAIDELPDDFRAVFVMRDVEAMSVAETADALAAELASALTDTFAARSGCCSGHVHTYRAWGLVARPRATS